ncbi:hypothetical protein CPB84DRAFT_1826399 [Gymnopilus junonius]|uniref:F-box domain-containing protein n=1 Tax=Gymnopilus junonius TaxID=109634 RepID=A0A9P5NIS0_GYMJU|nr:hypothetical protein CPB84DRAFT_1826399 [Gymnopilus junonius]
MTSMHLNQQSPSHRLLRQPDVLMPIFRLLVEDNLMLPPPPLHPQLVLSRVSRIWRGVMITSPAFWNTFTFKATSFRDPGERINVVKSFIQRSRTGPLSLSFETNLLPGQAVAGAVLKDLLFGAGNISIVDELIIPNVERIIGLKCLLYGTEISKFLLGIPRGAFRSLINLDLTFLNTYIDDRSNYIAPKCYDFHPFENTPHLDRITCNIIDCHINPLDLRFLLSQLTTLHFQAVIMPPEAFLRMMRAGSLSLVEASFSVELDSRWLVRHPQQFVAPIIMTSLKELDLHLIDPSWDPLFLLILDLPVLEKLCIGEVDNNFPFLRHLQLYAAVALRSAMTLKTLRLTDLEINPTTKLPVNADPGTYLHRSERPKSTSHYDLEQFLQPFPMIQDLALPLSLYIHHTTLEKIAMGSLLPLLEKLELGSYADASTILILSTVGRRNAAQSAPMHRIRCRLPFRL